MSAGSDGDLESRVSALERRVNHIAQDAAAARVLAGAADRDVSEFRAELRGHTQALNALRETQLEQGHELGELRGEMGELRGEMSEGFSKVNVGMAQITALLTNKIADEDQKNNPS